MTPMEKARFSLSTTAQAVVAVDRIVAPRYAAAVGAEHADPETIVRWNRAVEALLLTRSALLVAEATLDAVEAGEDHDIRATMGCVVVAVTRLIEALPTVGIDLPEALVMTLNLLGNMAGTCEPEAETSVFGVPHISDAIAASP
jgi:hypothetical protein